MKFTPWILLSIVAMALANCKKVEEISTFPAEFSAKNTYQEDNLLVIEEPMLWQMPLLERNAKLTAQHVCELLDMSFVNHRDAIQLRKLKNSVRGMFMGHDAFGQMTGLEYGNQNEVISEMYCQGFSPTNN